MQIHILTSAHMNLSTYIINNYRRMRNFQNFPLDESNQELKCGKNYISLNHYRVTQRTKMQKNLVLTRSQQHHRKRNKGWPASSPNTEKRSASKITENRTKVGQHHHRKQNQGRPASSPKTEQRSASKIKDQTNVKLLKIY